MTHLVSVEQNYMRHQADNVRTVNLVTEVMNLVSVMYTHINADVISVLTQVVNTLTEISLVSTAGCRDVIQCKPSIEDMTKQAQ